MDPLSLIMLAVLALLIFFMFRNSRKRQRDVQAMHERTRPGVEVMTNFGLFGTIVAIDDEENKVQLETGPGTILTVHRQTIAKIITPDDVVTDDDVVAAEEGELDASDPAYGERNDPATGVDLGKPATGRTERTDQ
ncbi:MAG TPA: preprotein translocase subunit YajC [Naasia sp.]